MTFEDDTRLQVAAFLPRALKKAIESYDSFIDSGQLEDQDRFLSNHNSCKAAIAHIHLLIKLSQIVDIPLDPHSLSDVALKRMLEQSEHVAAQNQDHTMGDDDLA